jgi:hypothetical protein
MLDGVSTQLINTYSCAHNNTPIHQHMHPSSHHHITHNTHTQYTTHTQPDMDELYTVLKEWGALLFTLYKNGNTAHFHDLNIRIQKLIEYKRCLNAAAMHTERAPLRPALKVEMVNEIEKGRRDLNLDIVVRYNNGDAATLDNTSFIKLYRMYQEYAQVCGCVCWMYSWIIWVYLCICICMYISVSDTHTSTASRYPQRPTPTQTPCTAFHSLRLPSPHRRRSHTIQGHTPTLPLHHCTSFFSQYLT